MAYLGDFGATIITSGSKGKKLSPPYMCEVNFTEGVCKPMAKTFGSIFNEKTLKTPKFALKKA